MAYSLSIDLPARLELVGDSLKVWMRNKTVQLQAEVEAEIPFNIRMKMGTAAVWGCTTWTKPCWDKLITLKTKIDLGITFGVYWNDNTGRISISVSLEETKFR